MKKLTLIEQVMAARMASVPLLKIVTTDPAPVIAAIHAELSKKKHPVLRWDVCSGILGVKDPESEEAALLVNLAGADPSEASPPAIATGNPVEALQKAVQFAPSQTMLIMLNGGMFASGSNDNDSWKPVAQAIWNCRDEFKSSDRTLVLIGDDFRLPGPLKSDVIELVDPVPTREDIAGIVRKMCSVAKVEVSEEDVTAAVECLAGILSQFLCENIVAMSFRKMGGKWAMDFDFLWSQAISAIERTSGLKVIKPTTKWSDIIGLESAKAGLQERNNGPLKPVLVVLMDEVDAQFSGVGTDTSGTSTDAYGHLLTEVNDNGWSGVVYVGIGGTGKTELAKAMGCEADGLFVSWDSGAMKDKFVGQSEQMVRNATTILKARGGEKVFFVCTTNNIQGIPYAFLRRMEEIAYFKVPIPKETLDAGWSYWMKKFEVPEQPTPDCNNWTIGEIRKCCRRNWSNRKPDGSRFTLMESAKYIVPVFVSMGADAEKMGKNAHNKYLDASKPGLYQHKEKISVAAVSTRKLATGNN